MAARLRGSSAKDGALVLYSAADWKERVHLMRRDCVIETTMLSDPVSAVTNRRVLFMPNGTTAAAANNFQGDAAASAVPMIETLMANDAVPASSVVVTGMGAGSSLPFTCVQSSLGRSILRKDLHHPLSAASGTKKRTFRSILLQGQPFAYAGDVTLTALRGSTGEYSVAVDRLYGNEVNEYTMVNVRTDFPANPPADTIKQGGATAEVVDRLPTPYAFSDVGGVQHPAVSTRSSVFFAVNPLLAMFKGFARGCLTGGMEWRMQLSALSSYAPIRVWKMDPFGYCPHLGGGSERCSMGRVHFVDIPEAFTQIVPAGQSEASEAYHVFDIRKCTVPFAVAVTSLEHINDENVAITVLRAPFSEYDVDTGLLRPNARNASYRVYFLSTVTMALSDVPWEQDVVLDAGKALQEGALCPAMRRLPNVGSFTAEIVVAGAELFRKALDVILMVPALVQMWRQGGDGDDGRDRGGEGIIMIACPLVTHGHSLLQRCGSDLLSLDEFFDALNRANAHFWRSFSLVAERVRDMGEHHIANIIDGVAYYGESTISPTTAYASIVRTVQVPTKEMGTEMLQGVIPMAKR
jgi:hypothetical protein